MTNRKIQIVNDVPAKLNVGFNPITFSKRSFEVINAIDKPDESWLILAIHMPEGYTLNNVNVPLITLPLAVSAAKLAQGESLFKPLSDGKLEVVENGLLMTMNGGSNKIIFSKQK